LKDGQLKIGDFGVSAVLAKDHTNDLKAFAGTVNYMSPEAIQMRDYKGQITSMADLWSIACIIHELATGKQTFTGCYW
jgi:serine/threonine protein kinase